MKLKRLTGSRRWPPLARCTPRWRRRKWRFRSTHSGADSRGRVARRRRAPRPAPAAAGAADASTRTGTRPTVALTLDEAIKLALDRNLDIAVQRLNPQTFDFSLAGLQAFYRPTLTSTLLQQVGHATRRQQTIVGRRRRAGIDTTTTNWNGGVAQNLPWGGGGAGRDHQQQPSVHDQPERRSSTRLYQPNWAATVHAAAAAQLPRSTTRGSSWSSPSLNQDISEIQLQASIINTISNVRNAYWDYVFAVQSVDVARRSVELAEQLVKDNQTRVEIGTMAPIDVVQAQSQAATQRQNMATAQGTRRTAELDAQAAHRRRHAGSQLERAISNPTDQPDFRPEPVDVDAAVRRALDVAHRPGPGQEEPADQRRHAAIPAQPDAAAG